MIYVGMDGGGTKTALLARTGDADRVISRVGPGVNPQRVTLDESCRRLTLMLKEVREVLAAESPMRVFGGLSGAGRPSDQHTIARVVETSLGGDVRVHITHDADIALDAAFPNTSGAIVIAGTGSVLLARTRAGTRCQIGGWGYLLGDEGSGTVLGLEGIRAICRALDGGAPTRLTQLAAEHHALTDREAIIHKVYRADWPFQNGTGIVLQAAREGDAVARSIVEVQSAALAQQLACLARTHPDVAPRYTLLGGLNSEDVFRDALCAAIARLLPDWTISTAPLTPTEAALHCAEAFEW